VRARKKEDTSPEPRRVDGFLEVEGYKSIAAAQRLHLGKVSLLAGPNSSGKSSLLQPLLLIKQTLECSYDPGGLLLSGPNISVDAASDLVPRVSPTKRTNFRLRLQMPGGDWNEVEYQVHHRGGFEVKKTARRVVLGPRNLSFDLSKGTSDEEMRRICQELIPQRYLDSLKDWRPEVERDRCFLRMHVRSEGPELERDGHARFLLPFDFSGPLKTLALGLLHLPGLRGNPERLYPVSGTGDEYPGVFPPYTASLIHQWAEDGDEDRLRSLRQALCRLGLTSTVQAKPVGDTKVQLLVGRLLHASQTTDDLVSIADVGVGVSQVLPVLVALLAAQPGQVVFVEQPEIHLHPKAQTVLCDLMLQAADRGVSVVAETHSSLIVQGFQTLVAQGKMSKDDLKLHWCSRDPDTGETTVRLAELDDTGAFGDWPEDFSDTQLAAERTYLDAAMKRKFARAKK
jgi:hypothetical protein